MWGQFKMDSCLFSLQRSFAKREGLQGRSSIWILRVCIFNPHHLVECIVVITFSSNPLTIESVLGI